MGTLGKFWETILHNFCIYSFCSASWSPSSLSPILFNSSWSSVINAFKLPVGGIVGITNWLYLGVRRLCDRFRRRWSFLVSVELPLLILFPVRTPPRGCALPRDQRIRYVSEEILQPFALHYSGKEAYLHSSEESLRVETCMHASKVLLYGPSPRIHLILPLIRQK